MTPSQASQKYHWVHYDEQTKTIDLFLDHHVLSILRTCESLFVMEHLLNIHPKYGTGRKPWFLDFGSYMHYMFEIYYNSLKGNEGRNLIGIDSFLATAKGLWAEMNMDEYGVMGGADQEKYEDVGGLNGVLSLLVQYYTFYLDLRVRVVDTEISFGKKKEVLIGKFQLIEPYTSIGTCRDKTGYELCNYQVNCYLTGRIDLLIDNGNKIGPVDHKHTHKFRGDEWKKFNPQDAITGYILAVNEIMKANYPTYFEQGRRCLSAWVYHISACTPSKSRKTGEVGPRFKTTPIDKAPSQLEDYKARQLSTFKRVCDLLFNDKVPEWNTSACHFMFMRDCPMLPIHEAPSEEWTNIINSHYEVREPWNPNSHKDDLVKIEVIK